MTRSGHFLLRRIAHWATISLTPHAPAGGLGRDDIIAAAGYVAAGALQGDRHSVTFSSRMMTDPHPQSAHCSLGAVALLVSVRIRAHRGRNSRLAHRAQQDSASLLPSANATLWHRFPRSPAVTLLPLENRIKAGENGTVGRFGTLYILKNKLSLKGE